MKRIIAPPRADQVQFNGIDDRSGEYLFSPRAPEEIGLRAWREEGGDPRQLAQLVALVKSRASRAMGIKEGADPRRLEEAGWGVVFARDADPEVRLALAPLLDLRRRQAGALQADRYRELTGEAGYHPGDSKDSFMTRHRAGPGPVDPDRLPYYLLLVGGPEEIPFSFQYQLDVQHGVGRLAFDQVEDYARYAESVVAAEAEVEVRPRRAALFTVRQPGDGATEQLHDLLARPLAEQLHSTASGRRSRESWQIELIDGPRATRQRLTELLTSQRSPALLFTGSHGLGMRYGDPEHRERLGGLVCYRTPNGNQASRGPSDSRSLVGVPPVDGYRFTAAEVPDDNHLAGMVVFLFACFSAGSPGRNDFGHHDLSERELISERPFVARLPQRLLAHPRGGALAVIGHIDRAWTCSFKWAENGQPEVFASTFRRLLAGYPVGWAMELFNQRYAELECMLADRRRQLGLVASLAQLNPENFDPGQLDRHLRRDLAQLGWMWTARNDARNYILLGDPAVRLAVGESGESGSSV